MKLRVIFPLIVSIIIFIVSLFIYTCKKPENNQPLLYKTSNYEINIDIPNTNYQLINDEIKKFVQNEQNNLFSEIDISLRHKTILNISHEIKNNNNIETIIIYSNIEGENIKKTSIKTIHYNTDDNQIILLNNYIKEDLLQDLSDISYHSILSELAKLNISIDNNIIENMTLLNFENYNNYEFNESGLKLDFIIKQKNDIKITITLPYSQINYLLKDEYKRTVTEPYQRDLTQFKDKKLIAFTFDDGPSSYTEVLLNGLNKYNAKVTFFTLGSRVNYYGEILKRAYQEGNQIGSHTYSHNNLINLNYNQISSEINNANYAIRELIGVDSTVFRPPYGNVNNSVKMNVNVPIIMWNVDTLDWQYRDKETVKNNIISSVEDGDIILLHDLYLSSVEGALLAMDELYKQGFAFVTIDEMMQLKGTEWEKDKIYYKL